MTNAHRETRMEREGLVPPRGAVALKAFPLFCEELMGELGRAATAVSRESMLQADLGLDSLDAFVVIVVLEEWEAPLPESGFSRIPTPEFRS